MPLYQRKKSFIKVPTLINIPQICHFEVKDTWWVVLELHVILTQTVGRFDMSVTVLTGTLTLEKLKYFMSKNLNTKTL